MGKINDELPIKRHPSALYANSGVSISNLSYIHAVPACYILESLLRRSLEIICGPLHKVFDFVIRKFLYGIGESPAELFFCSFIHKDSTCLNAGRWFHCAEFERSTD